MNKNICKFVLDNFESVNNVYIDSLEYMPVAVNITYLFFQVLDVLSA